MVNPASIMKIMNARNRFKENHPKFAAFFARVLGQKILEGDVIEITVSREGEEPITANMRVTADDLAIIEELKSLSP